MNIFNSCYWIFNTLLGISQSRYTRYNGIPPLEGNPTHTYLKEFNGYLNACSESVHRNPGNGAVGYLAITEQPAAFALAYPNVFNAPANPGATLILLDPPATATVIGIQTCAHCKELWIFNEYYNVDKACKKIIFTLITEAYYCSFKNKHTRFSTVSCLTTLTHYGQHMGHYRTMKYNFWRLCRTDRILSRCSNSSTVRAKTNCQCCLHFSREIRLILWWRQRLTL